MKTFIKYTLFSVLACVLVFSSSCRKDRFFTEGGEVLRFSEDTLSFDTVFTTLGSTTKALKVFNDNKLSVKIAEINLVGSNSSNFRLNIDGVSGNQARDVEIGPRDSIYIFVEVTVDPTNLNNPFIIADEVEFHTNGSRQTAVLSAWGQNANFYKAAEICDETWTNDKPYVLLNNTLVPEDCFLRIEEGVRIYVGPNSGFFVEGTLQVEGNRENPVSFQGTRLEEFYDDLPGQWPGISILRGSENSYIRHAEIRNANFGVSVGSAALDSACRFSEVFRADNAPDLMIENTIISNSLRTGIAGFFSAISANNLLVYNSGDYLVSLGFGGAYEFVHCTFANYGSAAINHQTPSVFMSNVAGVECEGQTQIFPASLDAKFYNSIIYGSLENEIEFGDIGQGVPFDALFDHCLVRSEIDTLPQFFPNTIFNEDPQFVDRPEGDYTLNPGSPAIDAGGDNSPQIISEDLAGNMRGSNPDIGCYENQN
ncbi:MAG: choice-of-anchor Q domain-containing protein [Chitinophagales bacterium]